ncbi:MAG: diaminopimelate epimerase [Jatrophihabitantaceae bacterium]
MHVFKGHGTENDFVVVPDLDGTDELTPELVRALCDRHAGIGADGVLRVVRSAQHPDARATANRAPYFMDYRNADGSIAEMCGNGVRVFVRYLQQAGLVGQQTAVATRGGIKAVRVDGTDLTVEMGRPAVVGDCPQVTSHGSGAMRSLASVQMPNPHVIVLLDSMDELDAIDLSRPPDVVPGLPGGQNVEFLVRTGARELTMRVNERGVGETRSCGTGICAVVAAIATADGVGADGVPWQVNVPGGACRVCWRPDGEIELTGPAVIVAAIELNEGWLSPPPG